MADLPMLCEVCTETNSPQMRALLNHVQLHGDGPPNRYSSVTELAEVLDQIHISDIF
jgi:hypothetical protein